MATPNPLKGYAVIAYGSRDYTTTQIFTDPQKAAASYDWKRNNPFCYYVCLVEVEVVAADQGAGVAYEMGRQ